MSVDRLVGGCFCFLAPSENICGLVTISQASICFPKSDDNTQWHNHLINFNIIHRCGWKMLHCWMFGTMPHLLTLKIVTRIRLIIWWISGWNSSELRWTGKGSKLGSNITNALSHDQSAWTGHGKRPVSETILWLSKLQKEQGPGFPWCCHSPHHQRPAKNGDYVLHCFDKPPFLESWS